MAQNMYLGPAGEVLSGAGGSIVDQEQDSLEQVRVREVALSRMYYEGSQYDARNEDRAKALQLTLEALPEHEKLHAYSTQIQEGVDFIASQMSEEFSFKVDDKTVEELLLKALKRSPDLSGGYGENDLSLTNVVREALIAMDTPVLVRWDPVDDTAWPDFWDSEMVQFVYDSRDRNRLVEVLTRQSVWDTDMTGSPLKKTEIQSWHLNAFECVKETWFDGERELGRVEPLGVPFIPWVTLRTTRKRTRALRGESMITKQARDHADRYNAVEQISYLISRYNSHGNLAVIGDGATLKAQMDERINKDVADILTFPGGTALQVLTLPTDPQMIVHQRTVLIDSLFGSFGLARIDQETLTGLGQVTGYALEILNRKSNGTFAQIKNQYIGDFKKMLNMILDVTAYKQGEQSFYESMLSGLAPSYDDPANIDLLVEQVDAAAGEAMLQRMDQIDPMAEFTEAKRVFQIHLGTGNVVDRTMLRDDFTAGVISRAEVLRQEGYTDAEIAKIEGEIKKDKPPAPPSGLAAGAVAAGTAAIAAAAGAKVPGAVPGAKPAAAPAAPVAPGTKTSPPLGK